MYLSIRMPAPFIICAFLFLFIMTSCNLGPPSGWEINLDDVYSIPGIDYAFYNNIVVLKFMDNDQENEIEDKTLEKITHLVAEGFQEKAYDIVPASRLESFLDESQYSIDNLGDDKVLQGIRENLKISAVVRGKVNEYLVRPTTWANPWTHPNPRVFDYKMINICFYSLTMEMVDTKDGNVIWSSTVSCEHGQIQGHPDIVLKRMIKESLKTIPKK